MLHGLLLHLLAVLHPGDGGRGGVQGGLEGRRRPARHRQRGGEGGEDRRVHLGEHIEHIVHLGEHVVAKDSTIFERLMRSHVGTLIMIVEITMCAAVR